MVLFNYSTRELTAKVVYYGPGLCGKTTNLQHIYDNLPGTVKGKMLSLATKTDRTLFFDFLPIDLGEIRGMKTRVQLYTVPGQVFYNETRRLVLKGADGVVFVADSQAAMMDANIDSLKNLEENLRAHGMNLHEMPLILQYNKRDLANVASVEELDAKLNRFGAPSFEAVATSGVGVQETLKAITKLVLVNLTRRYDSRSPSATRSAAPPRKAPAPKPASVRRPPTPAPGGLANLREDEVVELLDDVREDAAATAPPARRLTAEPGRLELDESVASVAAADSEEPSLRRTAAPSVNPRAIGGPPRAAGGDGASMPAAVAAPENLPTAGLTLTEVSPEDALFHDDDLEIAVLRPAERKEILVPVQIEVEGKTLRYRLALRLALDDLRGRVS